jgi:hypothetical protein
MIPEPSGSAGPPLPRGLALAGSLLIVFHFAAVAVHVAAAPSGPWPGPEGPDLAPPPHLARIADEHIALPWLRTIKLTHNHHFASNRPGAPEAALEVRLLDGQGEVFRTVRFPHPQAPAWVRQRQALAARWLTEDRPVERPAWGERIPAPNQKAPEVPIWTGAGETPRKLDLTWLPEHELPRDRPVFRPSEWSLIVVRSLARHECRLHGAASARLVRLSREAIPPRILFERETPPEMGDLESHYGRLPR